MTPDQRSPTNGRRKTDWSLRRIIEVGTVIGILWAGFTTISAAIGARWATHAEVSRVAEKVDSVNVNVDSVRSQSNRRMDLIERRQDAVDRRNNAIQELLPAIARTTCIRLDIDRSSSIAQAAGLPCDSLLRRIR